jgi:hypothetical protein
LDAASGKGVNIDINGGQSATRNGSQIGFQEIVDSFGINLFVTSSLNMCRNSAPYTLPRTSVAWVIVKSLGVVGFDLGSTDSRSIEAIVAGVGGRETPGILVAVVVLVLKRCETEGAIAG